MRLNNGKPRARSKANRKRLLAFGIVFGVAGSVWLVLSHAATATQTMYRLYKSPYHMYTTNVTEKNSLVNGGWRLENSYPFTNPTTSALIPVYRLHSTVNGDHFWTTDATQKNNLVNGGNWASDGVKFYSATSTKVPYEYCRQPWYQLYNSGLKVHLYTPSATEKNSLSSNGWSYQKIAFNLDYPCGTNPAPPPPVTCTAIANGQKCSDGSIRCNSGYIVSGTNCVTPPVTCTAIANGQKCSDGSIRCNSGYANINGVCTKPASTPAPPAGPASTADATVAAGTSTASIKIPAGGAVKAQIVYGLADDKLINKTSEQTIDGSETTVILLNLDAKTKYFYQIVRINGAGKTATSPAANFTTSGYTITLQFTKDNGDAVPGIAGTINDTINTKAVSDKDGFMNFFEISSGTYTISYAYQGHQFSQAIDTATNTYVVSAEAGKAEVLGVTINVDKLLANPSGAVGKLTDKSTNSGSGGIVVAIILSLVALGVIAWFFIRRRRQHDGIYGSRSKAIKSGLPDIIDQRMNQHFKDHRPQPVTPAAHMGESLRDMVIKSMHEEAQKRKQKPPNV